MTITIPPCESYTNEITKATDTTFELLDDRLVVKVKYKYNTDAEDTGIREERLCDFHGTFSRSAVVGVILIWNTVAKTYDLDLYAAGQCRSFSIGASRELGESVRSKLEAWIFGT